MGFLAFFGHVWSFLLTLVRSLLALFSFRRRDPFSLPRSLRRQQPDAFARLRPITLTPRSIALAPAHRAQSTRTRSATSTLVPSGSAPPERTSPKLDPPDPASRQGTPDTSLPTTTHTASLPLTPPDRCYLAPTTSVTDCPYSEPWPAAVPLSHSKSKLAGSPLRLSIIQPDDDPIGSPPPARWSPVRHWDDDDDDHPKSITDDHFANVSNALISRSKSSIKPYDTSVSSISNTSLVPNPPTSNPRPTRRVEHTLYPQFHHPEPYAYAWRRHSAYLPGRPTRRSHADAYTARAWYDPDDVCVSPGSSTDSEDGMPLGRLLARHRQSTLECGGPGDTRPLKLKMSHARRMSDGCLLALAQSTPTRVGVRSRRRISVGLDPKDWLDLLSLRPSPDKAPVPPGTD